MILLAKSPRSRGSRHEACKGGVTDLRSWCSRQPLRETYPGVLRQQSKPLLIPIRVIHQVARVDVEETREQITRLDEAMKSIGESLKRKKCKGMEGLLEEGKEMMEEKEDSSALDAALIAAAQKVEHYEIASYGTLCTWAELMGHEEALTLLKEKQ